jgi:hypothetical protein
LASMMERNIRRVIRDAASRAQADGVGMGAFEIVEPELKVELARIVFDERELRPTHRLVDPAWSRRRDCVE